MNELDRLIRARIDAFVKELDELVRRAALEAVSEALGGAPRAEPQVRRSKTGKVARAQKGERRSPSELESLAGRVERWVSDHPGSGARQIADALDVSTKDLILPLKKLTAAGSLTTKGQKRATKYFRGKK